MNKKYTLGFDFGTTNSLVSVVRGTKTINFLDDEDRPIPSVVCYEGARRIVGREAKERVAQAGLGIQGNIVRSPKMYLGQDGIFVEGVERSPTDIVADVVQHVLHTAKRQRDLDLGNVAGAVVTIPVDMDGRRRRALREAFRKTNMRIVQFVHEPLAALYGLFRKRDLRTMARRYEGRLVLVFDWGGGTLDLTLCRLTHGMVVQLTNDGTDEVGGDVFDETVLNHVIRSVSSSRGPNDGLDMQPGAKERLLHRCEEAKIALSSRSAVEVYVPNFFRERGDDDIDYTLSQSEFEDVVMPLLDKGFRRIASILDRADFSPEQVALCVATGGMSNMPAVRRRLHELFGPERVEIPDGTATLIAEGAAWIASDKIRLHLAKNVECVLARNSYLSLVKAGTPMPREGEVQKNPFHLYCTDPRDGFAKFQICSPKRAGETVLPNDMRTNLEVVTVAVDHKAQPFQERLELGIEIDQDLILSAHARSLNAKDQDQREIHNLEFGVVLPTDAPTRASTVPGRMLRERTEPGTLAVRANVSNQKDPRLIPGELLHECEPHHFGDTIHHPSREQDVERLYYKPCADCRRASNDPLCLCDSVSQT